MKRLTCVFLLLALCLGGGAFCSCAYLRVEYDSPEEYAVGGGVILSPVHRLSVDWLGGSVRIEQTQSDALSFTDGVGTMCYRLDGDTLDLQYAQTGDYFLPPDKTLTVYLPETVPLQTLTVHTVSADVTLAGVPADETVLTTSTGNGFFAFPYDAGVTFDIYGGFTCALPVKRRNGKYICGDGKKQLSFQSTDGNCQVEVIS